MKPKLMFRILAGLLILSLMIGCKAVPKPASLTLSFTQNKCSYSGPKKIHAGVFMVDLTFPDKNPLASGFGLITLNSGKTIADLRAWPNVDPPAWVTVLDVNGDISSERTFNYDLTTMDAWHSGESLYLVCFQMDSAGNVNKIGQYGPINVES